MRTFYCLILLFVLAPTCFASPSITEVMWAGSDLSTSDEWLELHNPDESDIDLSGWKVTGLSSKGGQTTLYSFQTGAILPAGAFLIVAKRSAASSRLLEEPAFLAPDLTLLNSGLQVRLLDASGLIVDEVDDGVGVPFAGANPSGTGAKASMERVHIDVSGNLKENWRTAVSARGLDVGASLRGTPGYPFEQEELECSDPLSIRIDLQSGTFSGVAKLTLNVQAIADTGGLPADGCSWNFGDGEQSTSCNPPSHSYANPGTYILRLSVKNKCGIDLIEQEQIQVDQEGGSVTSITFDGQKLYLSSALPNPVASDTSREWIEIRNPNETPALLSNWYLEVGKESIKKIPLKGIIQPREKIRIYDGESKLSLPNTPSVLTLVSPIGEKTSSIEWKAAEEDRIYYPSDLRDVSVRGRVNRILGTTVLEVILEPASASLNSDSTVFVKLLGIEPFSLETEQDRRRALELLSSLAQSKIVDLEFDEELWDERGRLLAYVFTDERQSLQSYLLASGDWSVDRALDFKKKTLFLSQENPEIESALMSIENAENSQKLSNPSPSISAISYESVSDLSIAEIFPSPVPNSSNIHAPYLSQEWLELEKNSLYPLNISGVYLQVGKRKKLLKEGLISVSGSLILVSLSQMKIPLPNGGGTINLMTQDGISIASHSYPKLKHGHSFIYDGEQWCETASPTPLTQNTCTVFTTTSSPSVQRKVSKGFSPTVKRYAQSYTRDLLGTPADSYVIASKQDSNQLYMLFCGVIFGISGTFLVLLIRKKFFSEHDYLRRESTNSDSD